MPIRIEPVSEAISRILKHDVIVMLLERRLRGKKWILNSGSPSIFFNPFIDLRNRRMVEREVTESDVFYDIGAHVGFYTVLASELVGERGRVLAFEPDLRNLAYLRKHLQINSISNVEVIGKAVSDKEGKALFEKGDDSYTGGLSEKGTIPVDTISLDGLLQDETVPPPDFLRINVEGAELQVLVGARQTISRHNPRILLAIHGPELRSACLEFLNTMGYLTTPVRVNRLGDAWHIFAWKEERGLRPSVNSA